MDHVRYGMLPVYQEAVAEERIREEVRREYLSESIVYKLVLPPLEEAQGDSLSTGPLSNHGATVLVEGKVAFVNDLHFVANIQSIKLWTMLHNLASESNPLGRAFPKTNRRQIV